jgi:hypothetical protein
MTITKKHVKTVLIAGASLVAIYMFARLSPKQRRKFLSKLETGAAKFVTAALPYILGARKIQPELPESDNGPVQKLQYA